MSDDPGYYLTEDAWKRMSRVVRVVETWLRGHQEGGRPAPAAHTELVVVPTGMPVEVPEDGPAPLTPAGGSGEGGGGGGGSGGSPVDVPAPQTKVVFPGRYLYRSLDDQDNARWWIREGDDCWIQETNNQGLWIGHAYPATPLGELNGVGVVGVTASADPQKMAVVAATPELTIAGVDYWPAVALMFDVRLGQWVDALPYDNEILVFDPAGRPFAPGDEVWGKLQGPVEVPGLYGSGSGYGAGRAVTAFIMLSGGGTIFSGGDVLIRVDGSVRDCDPDLSSHVWLTDPSTQIYYYYGPLQDPSLPPGVTPPDSSVYGYLLVYNQTNVRGATPDVHLAEGETYSGEFTGIYLTLCVDLMDGGDPEDPPHNRQAFRLPVFWTAYMPPVLVCNSDHSWLLAPGRS